MEKKFVLFSGFWATLLMVVIFIYSSLSGPPSAGSGFNLPRNFISGSNVLKGRIVVLDPGHGGPDPGTVGVGPTTESENVLAIAWELKKLLEKAGAEVIMTRQTDFTPERNAVFGGEDNGQLAARVAKANRGGGQIYISLHNNWNDNQQVAGTTVYYYKAEDLALAEALQRGVVRQLNSVDLGVVLGNFYVLRNTRMPAALVEVGFLSNPEEALLLSKPGYRLEAARGLFYGIVDYFQD
ncbi:MAG: N-acetylmuramoyl-L-alanine amidase [Firmicutes bacterium]|nr:N-acetylmuramoyl-L-alanine amidase [Bacillota bacterium]